MSFIFSSTRSPSAAIDPPLIVDLYSLLFGWSYCGKCSITASSATPVQESPSRSAPKRRAPASSSKKKKKVISVDEDASDANSTIADADSKPTRHPLHNSLSVWILMFMLTSAGYVINSILASPKQPLAVNGLEFILSSTLVLYTFTCVIVYALFLVHQYQVTASTEGGNIGDIPAATPQSLAGLYFQTIFTFSLVYLVLLISHGEGTFQGLDSTKHPLENFVHTTYFSISILTTVGFGDCFAVWYVARLFVILELILSSLLHILIFGKGIDIVVNRKQVVRPANARKLHEQ